MTRKEKKLVRLMTLLGENTVRMIREPLDKLAEKADEGLIDQLTYRLKRIKIRKED